MAFEWQLKEIELTEKYDLENYNISQTYSQIKQLLHQYQPAGKGTGSIEKGGCNRILPYTKNIRATGIR